MVASLYAFNFDERVREVLEKCRRTFVQYHGCGLTPCIVGVHPVLGFGSALDCAGTTQMRSGIEFGNTIIGGACVGTLDDGRRAFRVQMASADRQAAFQAIITISNGWPVLGEFEPFTPHIDLTSLFKGTKQCK